MCSSDLLRQLLDRIEDASTGLIKDSAFNVDIPAKRIEQARNAAAMTGEEIFKRFPLQGQTQAVQNDPAELILNRSR